MIWEALKNHTNAKQLSPHAIRHTYATEMARRGMTATTLQKSLGHEHLETTQRYIDFAQVGEEQEIRSLSIFN
jgi:site-specific recombinase XerD